MMIRRWIAVLAFVAALMRAAAAFAVAWDDLSDAQREVLSKYQLAMVGTLERATAATRRRRAALVDDGSRIARDDAEALHALAIVVAGTARRTDARFQQFKSLSPEQQQKLRMRMQNFRKLSPEQQRHLRDRFRELSPQQRSQALDRMKERRPTGVHQDRDQAATSAMNDQAETAAAASIRAVHAGRQRARDGESARHRLRHDHLRSGRRGCAGREGDRASAGRSRGARRWLRSSRTGVARERYRYAVGGRRSARPHPICRSTRCCCRRSNRWSRFAHTSSGWSARSGGVAAVGDDRNAARRARHRADPRRQFAHRSGRDGHQRSRQGTARAAHRRPPRRCCLRLRDACS